MALQAVICAVVLGILFGGVMGERGPILWALVGVPSVVAPFLIWIQGRRKPDQQKPSELSR